MGRFSKNNVKLHILKYFVGSYMIDVKKIRYFSAVAQYGSISEAARHLFIVQPALSRQIAELEYSLGVSLFLRRQKGIELTAAGEQLLKDCTFVLQALDQATTNVKRIGNQQETLHIGSAPSYTWNPFFIELIKEFQEEHPGIKLILEPTLAIGQTERLQLGTLDAGFMAWRQKADTTKAAIPAMRCHLLIACSKDSPLNQMSRTSLKQLENEPCLFFPREMSPEFYDFTLTECRKAKFKPNIVEAATDFNSCLGLASSGLGYTIISSASRYNCPSNINLIKHKMFKGSYDLEFVYRIPVVKEALQQLIDFSRKKLQPIYQIKL